MRGADVFCAPSLDGESFGVVLLEAMAASTAIVASDLPGYRNVARPGDDALLIPPGDVAALADGAGPLPSSDRPLRERLVASGECRAARILHGTPGRALSVHVRAGDERRGGPSACRLTSGPVRPPWAAFARNMAESMPTADPSGRPMIAGDPGLAQRVRDNRRRAVLLVWPSVPSVASWSDCSACWSSRPSAPSSWSWSSAPRSPRQLVGMRAAGPALDRGRPRRPRAHARLINLVEGLCIDRRRAAARPVRGRRPRHERPHHGPQPPPRLLVVTSGLLAGLNRIELEAVLAHELSHIKSYDILTSTLAVALVRAPRGRRPGPRPSDGGRAGCWAGCCCRSRRWPDSASRWRSATSGRRSPTSRAWP